jgi:putative chitinase
MLKFDRKKFFDGVKEHIDSTLEQEQVDGFTFLLDRFESTPMWSSIPLIAYGLATPYHETAGSMQPVEEGYYLGRYGKKRVKDFQRSLRYFPYFGRGFVQLTWETRRIPNYSRATRELREQMPLLVGVFEEKTGKTFDLVKYPDQALDPIIAFAVMTLGMFQGWFTTKKITDFIHGSTKNYLDARTVINGHDKAALIAGYAKTFEAILRHASGQLVSEPTTEPVVIDRRIRRRLRPRAGLWSKRKRRSGFSKGSS